MNYNVEDIEKVLIKAGLKAEKVIIEDVKGYGAMVYIVRTADTMYVIKVFKDFQPYPSIPYYHKERVSTEAEVYEELQSNFQDIVPELFYFNVENGTEVLEYISEPYKLFESTILSGQMVDVGFFKNFAKFLHEKNQKLTENLDQPFYSYKDAQDLRVLFTDSSYLPRISDIFEYGSKRRCAINLAGLSPKNMFVSGDKFKLIDFEEAFFGDDLFDVGFFVGHLLLYTISDINNHILSGIKEFILEYVKLAKLSERDKEHILNYAGIMLLHRASGFNLKGDISASKVKILKIGEELINSIDSYKLI